MKQKNLILMVVAVGCGLVAAFLTTQINAKGPKVEQVEVLVAAKDLAVGTLITKADLPKLVTKKTVAKDSLPLNFVNDENELIDKRLSAPVLADGFFNPAYLSTRGVIILPEGKDMVSLPMPVSKAASGFVSPGAHVDVLASLSIKNKLTSFPLLIDMQVLTVDSNTTIINKGNGNGAFTSMSMVSLAVTQEQALVLTLAKKRGCDMELLLRNPNKPIDPNYNMNNVKKLLQDDSPQGVVATEGARPNDTTTPADGIPPSAPKETEAPKPLMVKIYKATVVIPANTEVTKDLVAQSFTTQEIPKELAEQLQAYQDLTPFFGQVFKNEVAQGQPLIKGMIGNQVTKAAPPDEFVVPKPTPEPKVEPRAETKPVEIKRTHDVTLYGANGTMIHRYQEVRPGEWKLVRVMTPEEAAKGTKADGTAETPATPPTPDEKGSSSVPRKVD